MKKLLELEERLRKAKEELENLQKMDGSISTPMDTTASGDINVAKKEKHEDEKEDKKMIAEALDEHNEKKHGEAKDQDSAHKDMDVEKGCQEVVKFEENGQWRMEKAAYPDAKVSKK